MIFNELASEFTGAVANLLEDDKARALACSVYFLRARAATTDNPAVCFSTGAFIPGGGIPALRDLLRPSVRPIERAMRGIERICQVLCFPGNPVALELQDVRE